MEADHPLGLAQTFPVDEPGGGEFMEAEEGRKGKVNGRGDPDAGYLGSYRIITRWLHMQHRQTSRNAWPSEAGH